MYPKFKRSCRSGSTKTLSVRVGINLLPNSNFGASIQTMSKRKIEEFGDGVASDGTRRFKEKHSLDSDEEDNEKEPEKLDLDDIEGQEDDTVDFDDGIKITPFNMNEEMEEGHFDKDGMYIYDKKGSEIRDEWIDTIDWQSVKHLDKKVDNDGDSDSEPEKLDLKRVYGEMVQYVQPGESIAKALRRLGGNKGKHMSSSQRWKAKKQKSEETEENKKAAKNKEDMLKLTDLANKALQDGNMDIYEMTFEKLSYELKQLEEKNDRVTVPEDMDDDDALDMFADDIDKTKPSDEGKDVQKDGVGKADGETKSVKFEETSKEANTPASTEVMWEYRWEEKEEGAEIHGPYTSSQMLEWSESGFFEKGVYCRKVGTQTQWYSSKRVDFDLYT